MIEIRTLLEDLSFSDLQAAAEKNERERRANDLMAKIDADILATLRASQEAEERKLAAIKRPEYKTLSGAKIKERKYLKYQAACRSRLQRIISQGR